MNNKLYGLPQTTINRREFCTRLALVAGASGLLGGCAQSAVPSHLETHEKVTWNDMPISPQVHSDRIVTFRFQCAKARTVLLAMSGSSPVSMKKNSHGLWSITVGPLAPEIYSYAFTVEGARILDPLNPWIKPNLFYSASMFLVPGKPPALWEQCNVPHGVVHRHYYHSDVVGDNRDFYVYTPPGYDPQSSEQYPVLYLLHGYSDQANGWIKVGRANFILDNLIAQRRAAPMIMVMPLGYGDLRVIARHGPGLNSATLCQSNIDKFRATLFEEVMPRIRKNYNIKTGKDNTAIAGLSMGGGESLVVGLNNLNRFAWVGGMSSYVGTDGPDFSKVFPTLSSNSNSQINLLWNACGKQDPIVLKSNRNLDAWFTARSINYTAVWTPGDHDWRVWRGNLAVFASLLFLPRG